MWYDDQSVRRLSAEGLNETDFLYLALIALLPGLSTRAGFLYAAGAKQQAAVAQNAACSQSRRLCRLGCLRDLPRRCGQEVQRQPALEACADAQWHGRDLRELSRTGQGPRRGRRRRHQDQATGQADAEGGGCDLPGLPRGSASQLPALSPCQGRRRLHQLPQRACRGHGGEAAEGRRSRSSASSATPM